MIRTKDIGKTNHLIITKMKDNLSDYQEMYSKPVTEKFLREKNILNIKSY